MTSTEVELDIERSNAEIGSALREMNVVESSRNHDKWKLMTKIRANEEIEPVARFALGMIGTREALAKLTDVKDRIQETVGQIAIGMGNGAQGDTFVYGQSTGEIYFNQFQGRNSELIGSLVLRLGKTFTSAHPRPGNFRTPVGQIHNGHGLLIAERTLRRLEMARLETGENAPEAEFYTRPVNVYGLKEILEYPQVGSLSYIIAPAQMALEDKVKPDHIYWYPYGRPL